jgi:SsrA-binding protein
MTAPASHAGPPSDRASTKGEVVIELVFDSCPVFSYYDAKISSGMAEKQQRVAISNRKARHEYIILDTLEAGIVLRGTEVKSVRAGNANLQDSYAAVKDGEVWLFGMHISPYEHASVDSHDPRRTRKLLINRQEIRRLLKRVHEKGLTLIPLSVYFKGPYAKVELAIAQGKRSYDKREAIRQREARQDIARRMKRSIS